MGSYVPFSKITAIVFAMILKVWAYSGLVLVFCFLIYYLYGGILAISLLFFAVTGMYYKKIMSIILNCCSFGSLIYVSSYAFLIGSRYSVPNPRYSIIQSRVTEPFQSLCTYTIFFQLTLRKCNDRNY